MKFFNTLSGKIENFQPITNGEVRMYTCGPTVYDYAHIGNFRAFVFEDLLRRFLESRGLRVRHVMNITDVDDKTIAGAKKEGKKLEEFTAFYTKAFQEDLKALNILPPTEQPFATKEMKEIVELIRKLVEKDHAYEKDGSVYYRVASFPRYGKLSKKKLEKNIRGARVDVDAYEKEEGADFALWKKTKEGEPSWDSPWGKGRPGWHIECSAMSLKHLGDTFDIHAGGEDLIFPHHENEIAQSEGATGKPFVKYWLHCKFLLVNGEKMSKSKGNFYTLRDLLKKGHDPMAIRYALLATHYRTPLNFDPKKGLKEASDIIKRLDDCYYQVLSFFHYETPAEDKLEAEKADAAMFLENCLDKMAAAMDDDLNVSVALAHLFEGIKWINAQLAGGRLGKKGQRAALEFFRESDRLLGLDIAAVDKIPREVFSLCRERQEVRGSLGFRESRDMQKKADELRNQLAATGWLVKDPSPAQPQFSTVKVKRRAWDRS